MKKKIIYCVVLVLVAIGTLVTAIIIQNNKPVDYDNIKIPHYTQTPSGKIEAAEKEAKEYKEHLNKNAHKAWYDAEFGMTKAQVLKTFAFRGAESDGDELFLYEPRLTGLPEISDRVLWLRAEFSDNHLSKVELESDLLTSKAEMPYRVGADGHVETTTPLDDNYSCFRSDVLELARYITSVYEDTKHETKEFPIYEFAKLESDKWMTFDEWQIGDSLHIDISIRKVSHEYIKYLATFRHR